VEISRNDRITCWVRIKDKLTAPTINEKDKPMNIYTPWLFSVVFAALIVLSRLITNSQLVKTGRIPVWLSLLYMIGIIGMIVTAFWSFVSIGWWGPMPIVLLYFAIGFVKSEIFARASGIADSQHAANELSYEEWGYMYADSLLPSSDALLENSENKWIGKHVDSEILGRGLAVLSLSIFQLSLVDLIPQEETAGRAIGGFMKRFTERYENFAFAPATSAIGIQYIQAAGIDLRNKNKTESFPTLVPLVITKITGLTNHDEYWPVATEVIYSFIETVLQTSRQAFEGTTKHAKLV
jgi:hypothetical protein